MGAIILLVLQNIFAQVEGWKLVDLMALNEALEAAQLCGHNRLVLVEADRKVSREGLSAIVGFVCRQCGAQTLIPTSKFSRTSPTGFQVYYASLMEF